MSRTTDEEGDAAEVDADEAGAHLDSVPSGAGCTEIWEELSEQREENADGATDAGERSDAVEES